MAARRSHNPKVVSSILTGRIVDAKALRRRQACPQASPLGHWPCGLMDKALVFGTKDCRFESCQGHFPQPSWASSGSRTDIDPRWQRMDTLGFEPRAFRMRSGCDTTTPCALERRSMLAAHSRWPLDNGVARQDCHTPGQDRTGDLQRVRLTS